MGQPDDRPAFSLDEFHVLFQQAHWGLIPSDDDANISSEDILPEASYRNAYFSQNIEIGYHEPIDQIALSISDGDHDPSLKLFFFLGNEGRKLVQTLISFSANQRIELNRLNTILNKTASYCQFTLLELPGEGLFEVGPQKAQV